MGLSHLKFSKHVVSLGEDGEFSVRGLSIEDVTPILYEHREALETLFDRAKDKSDDMLDIAETLAQQAPEIAAKIIAYAADDANREGFAVARKLPLPAQIEALEAIGRLTFRGEDSLKNLVKVIARVATSSKAVKSV